MLKWNIESALLSMVVGDSFFVPTIEHDLLAATIRRVAHRENIPVAVRIALSDGATGVRVWRVEKQPDDVDTETAE